MTKEKKLQVEAIRNGSVIDHIPHSLGIKILTLFKLQSFNERITIGINLPSSALGKKDLIKIEHIVLTKEQANQLSLYAPNATVNQIEEFNVVKKLTLTLPEKIVSVFKCPNQNCISHNEPVDSCFSVSLKNEQVRLKCHYCEKSFSREIMVDKE